jgi:hypothetical protein
VCRTLACRRASFVVAPSRAFATARLSAWRTARVPFERLARAIASASTLKMARVVVAARCAESAHAAVGGVRRQHSFAQRRTCTIVASLSATAIS